MELTPEKVRELLNLLLLRAKENRAKIPYSNVDGFAQAVVFLGPNLEPVSQPVTWKDEAEKYRLMGIVSNVAKAMLCQAVALITDTRWVEESDAVKVLGIPPSSEVGMEKFQENYKRVITARYKGYVGNAPKELFTDAIVIAIKGPRLDGPQIAAAPYEQGPNDTIHWLSYEKMTTKIQHFNLIPDWWC